MLGACGGGQPSPACVSKTRATPHPNFNFFSNDFSISGCAGPGLATVDKDIATVFRKKFSDRLDSTTSYVSPDGSDTNDGKTPATAFKTLGMAIRRTANSTIILAPGEYDVTDFRSTDVFGSRPKMVIARSGATLRIAGDDIAAPTWTPDTTYPSCYSASLQTEHVVKRLLMTTRRDSYGEPTPLAIYSSVEQVNGSSGGFWHDKATNKLWVKIGADNIETTWKSNLLPIYGTADGDPRLLLASTISYWENITFLGCYPYVYFSESVRPQFWSMNCTFKYSPTHAILSEGGITYLQNCRSHRPTNDGANYNTVSGQTALAVEIGYRVEHAGDTSTFGNALERHPYGNFPNKNGSSNHSGHLVRVNGEYLDAYGPLIADTSASFTWCVGSRVSRSLQSSTVGNLIGFLMLGNTSWLDSCASDGVDIDFNADSTVVYYSNLNGGKLGINGGSFVEYN